MAVTRIKKVRLLAHHTIAGNIAGAIQKLGCCELIPPSATAGGSSVAVLDDVEQRISELRPLLRFLEPFYTEERGALERMLSDKPGETLAALSELSDSTETEEITIQTRKLEKRLAEIRSNLSQITTQITLLTEISDFPYPLSFVSPGTDRICGFAGTIDRDAARSFEERFRETVGAHGEFYLASPGSRKKDTDSTFIALFCREQREAVSDLCSETGVSRFEFPDDLSDNPSTELERLIARKSDLAQEEKDIHTLAESLAAEWVPVVRKLSDYLGILQKKMQALQAGAGTEQVSILDFWIPEPMIERLQKVTGSYPDLTDISISDPGPEDEPPSLMANPAWAKPYEPLTKLYGFPLYGGIDPTVYLGPFFFVFFGMCLGDAGYGGVMVILSVMALSKFQMSGDRKHFFQLFLLGGIGSVIFGVITGSFFGNLLSSFAFLEPLARIQQIPVVLEPMNDPMTLLAISLTLGVIQIFFGMFLVLVENVRKGDYIAALGDQVGWFLFLAGLGGMMLGSGRMPDGFSSVPKIIAIAGAVLLVLTQGREKDTIFGKAFSGVLSLYNVMSYLGDILSYSRLLALGLATTAIAMIFNMLAGMVGGVPYVGWLLTLAFILLGHVFSLAVNAMGAFVHSLRLQYVEFFSKFYTGGGRPFSPFRYQTNHVSILDEDGLSAENN